MIMEEYDNSTKLWDEVYSTCKLVDLSGQKLEVEPTFDACLKIFSDNTTHVMDYGCGTGDILFQCAENKHITYGLGIDRSKVGIEFAQNFARINHYTSLDFIVGDINDLSQMDEACFDGIILSNVLDVTPKDVAHKIFHELTRILTPQGYIFLKLNPYASQEKLIKLGLTPIGDNLYEEDGVLRLRELDTVTWFHAFEKDFTIERFLEFPYPWQDGMNRLFLLKKK